MVDVLCERVLRVGVAERGGNVAAYKPWVIVYYNYPDTAELLVLEISMLVFVMLHFLLVFRLVLWS